LFFGSESLEWGFSGKKSNSSFARITNCANASAMATRFSRHSFHCCVDGSSLIAAHSLLNALIVSAIFSLSFMTSTVREKTRAESRGECEGE
jgi:hypothetical protein